MLYCKTDLSCTLYYYMVWSEGAFKENVVQPLCMGRGTFRAVMLLTALLSLTSNTSNNGASSYLIKGLLQKNTENSTLGFRDHVDMKN